jgi:type IV secretion system protein VirB10
LQRLPRPITCRAGGAGNPIALVFDAPAGGQCAATRAHATPSTTAQQAALSERSAACARQRVEAASATRMAAPTLTVAQGTLIPAVLETAIDSDLPGYARAVVSQDVRGFDGTRVLIRAVHA